MTDNIEQTDPDLWDAAREEAARRLDAEPGAAAGYEFTAGTNIGNRAHARTLLELGWRPPEKVSDAVLCYNDWMAGLHTGASYKDAITFALAWAAERSKH